MISRHTGVNFPHEIVARDHAPDRFVHFRNARCRLVCVGHEAMLEPPLACVKRLHRHCSDPGDSIPMALTTGAPRFISFMGFSKATRIASAIGQTIAFVIGLWSILNGHL